MCHIKLYCGNRMKAVTYYDLILCENAKNRAACIDCRVASRFSNISAADKTTQTHTNAHTQAKYTHLHYIRVYSKKYRIPPTHNIQYTISAYTYTHACTRMFMYICAVDRRIEQWCFLGCCGCGFRFCTLVSSFYNIYRSIYGMYFSYKIHSNANAQNNFSIFAIVHEHTILHNIRANVYASYVISKYKYSNSILYMRSYICVLVFICHTKSFHVYFIA